MKYSNGTATINIPKGAYKSQGYKQQGYTPVKPSKGKKTDEDKPKTEMGEEDAKVGENV